MIEFIAGQIGSVNHRSWNFTLRNNAAEKQSYTKPKQ